MTNAVQIFDKNHSESVEIQKNENEKKRFAETENSETV